MIFQFTKEKDPLEDILINLGLRRTTARSISWASHCELAQQLFVVLGQARKVNKLVRKAESEHSGPGSNVLSGGEADLYLTLCRIQEIFKESFDKDINGKIKGRKTPITMGTMVID